MQPTLRIQKTARPLLAIILLVGSIYILLSLASYSRRDPSWNYSSSDFEKVRNLGGIVGSFLSDSLLQVLGCVSYLLALLCLGLGVEHFKSRSIALSEPAKNQKKSKWHLPIAFALFTICLTSLLSMIPISIYDHLSLGGALGHFVSRAGIFCFSVVGASLIFVGGLAASIILFRERLSLPTLPLGRLKFFESFKNPFGKIKELPLRIFKREAKPAILPTNKAPLSQKLEELFKKRDIEKTDVPETKPNTMAAIFSKAEPVETAPEKKIAFLPFLKKSDESASHDRVLLMDKAPVKKKSSDVPSRFELPSLQLLDLNPEKLFEISREELIANSRALEQKLLDFGVQGQVTNIHPGPIITLYEFEPAAGVKVKNILNLTDDLKLAMKAVSIRIIAPIPGKAAVGIEIPNPRRQTVYLREILQASLFQNSPSPLTLGMGKTTSGDSYVTDLAKMPHLLIAGATGSGKSVGLNSMIISMLYKATPDELKFIMIDPKMLELSVYEGIPHLLLPVVTDPKKAARALAWAVKEMERRYKLISSLGARNLRSYNEKVARLTEDELKQELERAAQSEEATSALIEDVTETPEEKNQKKILEQAGLDHYVKLPNIVVVIDELADLILVAARDVEESIARLAQMARAAGIHLIIATQRPSVDVITGVIKANLPTRCAFQVASKVDSRTIIDCNGAENLIGDGDMLFLPPGTSRLERLHGPFISEDEIAKIVRHLKTQMDPDYSNAIDLDDAPAAEGEFSEDADDDLYDQALQVVFETKSPSASMLQRRLRVGYNRAARMIERMEREGIVSAPLGGGKGREILVTPSYES
ncbi:MAG: translocase FtsK [Bacteriovoracaceae bacterium]|nr:translocase FtsK [Bacteriovoracaceae bacterium]